MIGLALPVLGGRDGNFPPAGNLRVVLHRFRTFEDAGQGVVIVVADRVELVVVAAGTAQREAHHRAAQRVELLVDDVHFHFRFVDFGEHFRTDGQKTRRDDPLVPRRLIDSLRWKQVAGNLVDQKLIVRLVFVERIYNVIAIPPGVAVMDVFVESVRIGVTGDVEPVSPPPFTVVR